MSLRNKGGTARITVSVASAAVLLLQLGQVFLLTERNGFRNLYNPVVAQLRDRMHPGDVVAAGTEIGFGVGFDQVVDDPYLGVSATTPPLVAGDYHQARCYPFEVAKPEQIVEFYQGRGFTLEKLTTCGGSLGCNEFVFLNSAGH